MKRSASDRLRACTLCAGLLASCGVGADAPSDLFGDPQPVRLIGYVGDAMEPFLSRDGRWLLFNNLNDPSVDTNLHYAERVDDVTFRYAGELRGANSQALDGVPSLDRDGNLYFVSLRSYDSSASSVYRGRFDRGTVVDIALVQGVSRLQPGIVNFDVEISPDGATMYTVDGRFGAGGLETADLVIARREGTGFVRQPDSAQLLANLNTDALEYAAAVSADGLTLLFTRAQFGPAPSVSIYLSQRAATALPFAAAVRLAALDGLVEAPTFTPDEAAIYYHRKDGERYAIYRAKRRGSVVSPAQLVFMAPTGTQFVPGSDGDPGAWELVVMNVDGSAREQLTNNREQEFLPHFSPDGTQLLYTRFLTGGYGIPGSISRITVYDFATRSTRDLTDTGKDSYPVWSPDGRRIAFLSMRNPATPGNGLALWVMNADGSDAREIAGPSGESRDQGWGDIAWSSQDWILIVVAENLADNSCFKTRMDKIRPDGTQRTQVTDGGPNCTPTGLEQNGDSDPGYSADGNTIYTSRGFPLQPPGFPGGTVRRLYAVADTPWFRGKPEQDLSLPSTAGCIDGVPKGSPDGLRVLLFSACAGQRPGVIVADIARMQRTRIADGFGPDWNPARPNHHQRGLSGVWWDPATSGQGLALEMYPDWLGAGVGFLFGGWFTYDGGSGPVAAQRWYSLAGNVQSGANSTLLAIYANSGGNFAAAPPTVAQAVGSAMLTFTSCSDATLSYALIDGPIRTGSIALTRATPNLTCANGPVKPRNADFEFSGFWNDSALPGQGVFVEVNNAAPFVFLAWYTYAPGIPGSATGGQRWYTGQATYATGAREVALGLYETTGGAFNAVTPVPTTREVGSATLRMLDCSRAQLVYAFSAGSNAGRSGSIAMSRSGATPADCRLP